MARGRRSLHETNSENVAEMTATESKESSSKPRSTRSQSKPSTRTTRRSIIPNSSDQDGDEDDVQLDVPISASRRVLKAVVVPAMSFNKSKKPTSTRGKLPVANGFLNDRDSSLDTPSLDNSDYETPGTSISTTPATSMLRGTRSTRKSALGGSLLLAGPSSDSRKRTRISVMDTDDDDNMEVDMSMDAQVARQLQEEEYASATKRQKTGLNKSFILDSDSDDTELSSVSSMAPSIKGKGKGKAKVTETHTGRRSVRSSLKKITKFDGILGTSDDVGTEDEYIVDEDEEQSDEDEKMAVMTSDDDDDVPLASTAKARGKARALPRTRKYGKGKKSKLSQKEKEERDARNARFAHIEDVWERKRAMNRERAEQNHPKLLTMWDDLAKVSVLEVQKAEQPSSINRRLKPFQLEGLSWMIRQEKTGYRGGLLGDEMGMGKTIQAVSLIMSDYPAKEPTLVVVPPVALMQWSNEIYEYTDGKLNVLVYHGTNAKCKKMTVKDLRKFDVIMVSYNSLESLHRKETKGWTRGENIVKEASALHAIKYHRLILDEAHSIKTRTTGVAKACFALKGTYKWCLSGTPVQNRIGEFFSLLRFLEVRPFADYFCRSCDCEQLHWQVDEDHLCTACNHGGSEHISVFNQELLNPITGDDPELREKALGHLHMITARMMLRRMKRDHTNSMELPMKDIIIHNEFFSAIERDFSTSIMTNSNRKFDTYVAQGVMLNNYANIFGLIMQMRQVANHPDLLLKKKAAEGSQNVFVCNICDEPAEDAVRSRCHHEFCRACVKDFMDTCEASGTDADCPRCHIALSIDFEQPELEQDEDQVKKTSIINRIKMENWTSSTKIEMLVYDLYKLRSKKQTLKSIVFSQFTSMLQLIEWRLRRAGFNTVMLDGSMTPAMRQKSIEHFMTNADVEVFLVSLKAGGVALNLTEASRVFIVDPWWNPAAEWQSADRCHRIGQKRPCVITRLCIEDSVESRMVALQEKKAAMIAGTVNNDKVAMDRLTPEDLQFLFRGS
ncbi:SNF2 family N-terminal domain-containing protein [Dendryphion nanum]|uniref:SNF2 family N-terminal domain-containing protein n=1 Tax=Dendryphion nanum TaxID=256645 RepID=A0A9P9IJ39_9PLEO|nr:SNF2 family N-terminal domain-containing protein [Dendryphion nanum]